jgi:hypothetical protein
MKNKNIVLDLDGVIADIASSIDEYIAGTGVKENYDYTHWLTSDNDDKEAMTLMFISLQQEGVKLQFRIQCLGLMNGELERSHLYSQEYIKNTKSLKISIHNSLWRIIRTKLKF